MDTTLIKQNLETPSVYETENSIIVAVMLPGIEKKDLYLEAKENFVLLRLQTKNVLHEKKIALPVPVDENLAEARYLNDLLRIELPKKQKLRAK